MTIKSYARVTSIEEFRGLMSKLLADGTAVGLDIETGYSGPDKNNAQFHPEEGFVVGISFTNSTDWARYVPVAHDYADNLDNREVAEALWPVLKAGLIVPHNAKFEMRMLSAWLREHLGEEIVGDGYFPVLSDTMIEAAIMGIYESSGLKYLVGKIFNHDMTTFEELFPGVPQNKKKALRFNVLELTSQVISYACEDALWALALHQLHYPQVKDQFIFKTEMSVLPIVCRMEDYGVRFDWEFMREVSSRAKDFLDVQYATIQEELSELVGEPVSINLGSPKQIGEMLYGRLGFKTTRMTKSTKDSDDPKMSTDAIALEGLAQTHPVVRRILEWKEVKKLIGSYLDKYERDFGYDLLREGFTHPSHMQTFVISGRFSVSEPGYQQLPAGNHEYKSGPLAGKKMTRYEAGGEVFEFCFRDAVICPDDHYAVGYDYSQAELRALAGESGEPALLEAFREGIDVHVRTASTVLGIPEDQVTKEHRKMGKTLNFALLYGMGVKSLAERLGVSFEEGQRIYNSYFEGYSKIADFVKRQEEFGKKNGYVVSKFGRKMTIWEYQSPNQWIRDKADRMAVNLVIQGAATGDMTKIAMVRANAAIQKAGLSDKIHLVMNIHDALEFYVHKSVPLDTVVKLLEPAVVFPIPGWPQIVADWHTWERWGSAKEVVKNEDGVWTVEESELPEDWQELPNTEDCQSVATPENRQELPQSWQVLVGLPDLPTQSQFEKFMAYVKDRPGDADTYLRVSGRDVDLHVRSSLSSNDQSDLDDIFGSCVVHSVLKEVADEDPDRLVSGSIS